MLQVKEKKRKRKRKKEWKKAHIPHLWSWPTQLWPCRSWVWALHSYLSFHIPLKLQLSHQKRQHPCKGAISAGFSWGWQVFSLPRKASPAVPRAGSGGRSRSRPGPVPGQEPPPGRRRWSGGGGAAPPGTEPAAVPLLWRGWRRRRGKRRGRRVARGNGGGEGQAPRPREGGSAGPAGAAPGPAAPPPIRLPPRPVPALTAFFFCTILSIFLAMRMISSSVAMAAAARAAPGSARRAPAAGARQRCRSPRAGAGLRRSPSPGKAPNAGKAQRGVRPPTTCTGHCTKPDRALEAFGQRSSGPWGHSWCPVRGQVLCDSMILVDPFQIRTVCGSVTLLPLHLPAMLLTLPLFASSSRRLIFTSVKGMEKSPCPLWQKRVLYIHLFNSYFYIKWSEGFKLQLRSEVWKILSVPRQYNRAGDKLWHWPSITLWGATMLLSLRSSLILCVFQWEVWHINITHHY